MDKLNILLYGDIDMNIIDGSSIWVTSIINTLSTNENIKITLLLKTPIKTNTVIQSVQNLKDLIIINPFENRKFKGPRMQVSEAANYIEILDNNTRYDCIIARGNLLCEEVCKKENLRNKLISYTIPEKHSKNLENISKEEKNRLNFIYENSRYMISQTEESKNLLIKILELTTDEKIIILPPMVPNLRDTIPSFFNKSNKLIYSGQFCKNWYIYNILKAYNKIEKENNNVNLIVVGNKFQKDLEDVKEEIIDTLEKCTSINWIRGVSRKESNNLMEEADIGIAWRSRQIDNDDSVEMSTKVLEYSRVGKPVVLNRTKMYEKLLGEDYPLFVENDTEEEFIKKVKLALYDEEIYYKAATTTYNSVRKYTFLEVYKSIHLKLWSMKKEKVNLLFAGHDFKFINKFIEYCKNSGKYEVKIDQWKNHNVHNIDFSKECLNWADIIFCEWGLGNAKWYSNNKKDYQKLIVRVHSQERRTQFYKDFNSDKIDKVICITPYMFEEISRMMNIPRSKIEMIFNYVDCNYFDKPKREDCSYNLGIVGVCPKSKRLDLAIDIFEKLWNEDSKYKLYIKGKYPSEYPWLMKQETERLYYEKIFNRIENSKWKDSVIFDGFGSDLDEWFTKIGYILSPSDFEGSHVSVAEGIAAGSVPIVFNWKGSDTIYEERFICRNVDEAVGLIKKYESIIGCSELKNYSYSNFDIEKIFNEIEVIWSDTNERV